MHHSCECATRYVKLGGMTRPHTPTYEMLCLSGRTRAQDCCSSLEGPHKSGKRTFLALETRGHFETLCWGPASNAHIPELGHQKLMFLVASMSFLTVVHIDRVEFFSLFRLNF